MALTATKPSRLLYCPVASRPPRLLKPRDALIVAPQPSFWTSAFTPWVKDPRSKIQRPGASPAPDP